MNGEIAAFHAGYVFKDGKRFLLPHGAMNDKFAFYSPGDLLFCEAFKILKTEYGIEVYDASKDDETYKLRLGGKVYLTYDFSLG